MKVFLKIFKKRDFLIFSQKFLEEIISDAEEFKNVNLSFKLKELRIFEKYDLFFDF